MYVFINRLENKVVLISNEDQEINGLEKFVVSKNFDFSKKIIQEDGKEDFLYLMLTAEEFLESYNLNYKEKRFSEYPPLEEQLDMIYWDMENNTENWKNLIKQIKNNNPKP